jgi:hypothetical protein
MLGDLEWKKRVVKEFYALMFNDCRPREAVEKYVGATCAGTRQALPRSFANHQRRPTKRKRQSLKNSGGFFS